MLKSVNFLWVGNSIANYPRPMASSLLSHFARVCTTLGIRYQFIVGADACNQVSKITAAYDPETKPFRDFILNGLHHANSVIGQDMFDVSDWAYAIEFNPLAHVLQVSYTPIVMSDSRSTDIASRSAKAKRSPPPQAGNGRRRTWKLSRPRLAFKSPILGEISAVPTVKHDRHACFLTLDPLTMKIQVFTESSLGNIRIPSKIDCSKMRGPLRLGTLCRLTIVGYSVSVH